MKRLLVLGGAEKSLPIFRYAKSQEYSVVLCDKDPECFCRSLASDFIEIDTTSHSQIIQEVQRFNLDGVLSFGSDVNALSAAYVADALGLPGNPPESVRSMIFKDLFRMFLTLNGFEAPRFATMNQVASVETARSKFSLPLIVKPVDGAGSAGVSIINHWGEFESLFEKAQLSSRSGYVVVEEFIERAHPHMIGGDIFVRGGEVVFWGLLDSRRDSSWAPFLPTGTSYPISLSSSELLMVKNTLQQLVSKLEFQYGGLNVELMFDKNGKLFVIEMAPRNGGNQIPDLLKLATGVDLIAALVDSALGIPLTMPISTRSAYVANYILHSKEQGVFNGLVLSPDHAKYLIGQELNVKPGEPVNAFQKATDSFGVLTFRFNSKAESERLLFGLEHTVDVSY